jgi:hypothetical protein
VFGCIAGWEVLLPPPTVYNQVVVNRFHHVQLLFTVNYNIYVFFKGFKLIEDHYSNNKLVIPLSRQIKYDSN